MNTAEVFKLAAFIDRSIRIARGDLEKLATRRIRSESYSRETLFTNMAAGRITVFNDLPVKIKYPGDDEDLVNVVRKGFPKVLRARTRNGKAAILKYMPIDALMNKWVRDKGIVSVTDLHFRHTDFEKKVEAEPLSDFNIYCHNEDLTTYLEMMTMVISTSGNVTETHSDDSDGSNHCLTGKKLWLVWDRLKGKKCGLEDVTFDDVTGSAHFSIRDFLRTKGAQWFLVEKGETLFLPGNYTHRVVTLEKYIGFGSFHVALPSYVRSLHRWILKRATDVTPKMLALINKEVTTHVKHLKTSAPSQQEIYGYPYIRPSMDTLQRELNKKELSALQGHDVYRRFSDTVNGVL